VTDKLAEVAEPTTFTAIAVLFERLGSFVPELFVPEATEATSTICVPNAVPAPTVTTNVKVPVYPFAMTGSVQEMRPPEGAGQVQPAAGVIETKVVFAGIASLNTPFTASNGPLFVNVCVYVMLLPAATGFGAPTFVTARSAEAQ